MKVKTQIKVAGLSALLMLSTGCVSLDKGQRMDYNMVSTIQKNVTTEADIRRVFGEPVSSDLDIKRGTKILTYGYENDDGLKKDAAGVAGAAAGGLLGAQFGGGEGKTLATGLGAVVGGLLANNAVTARDENQILKVEISLKTGRVVDYNYVESKGRTQKTGIGGGVNGL